MQPPCLIPGQTMNPCARRLYEEKVLGHVDLTAEWSGWRLRGRWLISPDGDRLNPERLRGILFIEACNRRVSQSAVKSGPRGKVVRLREKTAGALQAITSGPDGQE